MSHANNDQSTILGSQMVQERFTVPLSPPNSPRMSDTAAKSGAYHTEPHKTQSSSSDAHGGYQYYSQDPSRPQLGSYKSPPFPVESTAEHSHGYQQEEPRHMPSSSEYHAQLAGNDRGPVVSVDVPPTTSKTSALASPSGRLTPRSPEIGSRDHLEDDDDDLDDFGGDDQDDDGDKPPMTAAELRAHKRKMKRFRFALRNYRRTIGQQC